MKDDRVYIKVHPRDVNYVNRILEGYEYLGVLTTIDKNLGTCVVNSTADTRDEVILLLTKLDCPVTILPAGALRREEEL
ncbi:MAG: DUF4911 domain-containing protein [Dialister sp.]|nr:DUF4911 domain-containing protein [Dialister sp.]